MSFARRRAQAIRDLAVETIADPSSRASDVLAAEDALVRGDFDPSKLSDEDLATWRRLTRIATGKEATPVSVLNLGTPQVAICSRCSPYTDEHMSELRLFVDEERAEQEAPRISDASASDDDSR